MIHQEFYCFGALARCLLFLSETILVALAGRRGGGRSVRKEGGGELNSCRGFKVPASNLARAPFFILFSLQGMLQSKAGGAIVNMN